MAKNRLGAWGKDWLKETRGKPGGGDDGLSQVVTVEQVRGWSLPGRSGRMHSWTSERERKGGAEHRAQGLDGLPCTEMGRRMGGLCFHSVPLADCEKHRGEGAERVRFITVLQAGPASLLVGSVQKEKCSKAGRKCQ